MKIFDLGVLADQIQLNALPESNIAEDGTKKEAERFLYLLDLLSGDYISLEVLMVPEEEWDVAIDRLVELQNKEGAVAKYILQTGESRYNYTQLYRSFYDAPLITPKDFV